MESMKWKFSTQFLVLANLWQMLRDFLKRSSDIQWDDLHPFRCAKGPLAQPVWLMCGQISHELSLNLCFQGLVSRKGLHWLKRSRKQNHIEHPQSPKQAITLCNPFKISTNSILEFGQLPVSIIPTDAFPHCSNSQHMFAQSHLFLCQDGHSSYTALLYPGAQPWILHLEYFLPGLLKTPFKRQIILVSTHKTAMPARHPLQFCFQFRLCQAWTVFSLNSCMMILKVNIW